MKFYERFGEDVAKELTDWFNDVDATYRGELREINAHNFALFDAKLEQRLAEVRAEFRIELASTKSSLIRWMFGFWIGSWLTLVGTLLVLGRLGVLVPR
jgi:hypothetical protein